MAGSDHHVSLSESTELVRSASENSADYEDAKSPLADETSRSSEADAKEARSEPEPPQADEDVDAMMRGNRNSFDAQQREGAAKTAPGQLPEREKACKRKSSHISGAPKQSFAVKLRKISNAVDQKSWKSGYCVVEGLAILVRSFASVWFPSRQFLFLLEAAEEITVRAGPVMLRDIKNFKLAFLHGMEEPQAECNARMRDVLLPLREIRRVRSYTVAK